MKSALKVSCLMLGLSILSISSTAFSYDIDSASFKELDNKKLTAIANNNDEAYIEFKLTDANNNAIPNQLLGVSFNGNVLDDVYMHVSPPNESSMTFPLSRPGFMYQDPYYFKTDSEGNWKVRITSEKSYDDIRVSISLLNGEEIVTTEASQDFLFFPDVSIAQTESKFVSKADGIDEGYIEFQITDENGNPVVNQPLGLTFYANSLEGASMLVDDDTGSLIEFALGRPGYMYKDPSIFKTNQDGKWKTRVISTNAHDDIQVVVSTLIDNVAVYTYPASDTLVFE